jgi:hypothetical protein
MLSNALDPNALNFPLVIGLPSGTSAMAWETLHFVRLLLRYYADVRLLNSVHVRIAATGLPLPIRYILPHRILLSSPGSRT